MLEHGEPNINRDSLWHIRMQTFTFASKMHPAFVVGKGVERFEEKPKRVAKGEKHRDSQTNGCVRDVVLELPCGRNEMV